MPLPGASANKLSRLREQRRNQPQHIEPISEKVSALLEQSERIVIVDGVWTSNDNSHVIATGQAAHGTEKGHILAILYQAGNPKDVKLTADSVFMVRVYPNEL